MAETSTRLTLLRIDLGFKSLTDEQITYLNTLLGMAATAIARKGVQLTEGATEDDALVAMYAAWLYRKRLQSPDATRLPDMIRYELNDRLMHQKMAVTEE
ncbi:MAG: hypothetical protein EOM54_05655 [Clostridia bacterium]|nr:hypothetical protein [Clostridia bacterium]